MLHEKSFWRRILTAAGLCLILAPGGALAQYVESWTKSDEKGFRRDRADAEAGEAKGMGDLGVMYANGRGVAQSDEEAVRWFRDAAEAGNASAMLYLGFMYKYGRGVEQSDEEARAWLRKALAAPDALETRDRTLAELLLSFIDGQ